MSSRFQLTGSETKYEGRLVAVHLRTFRHKDGEEVTREVLERPGAVAIVAHDGARDAKSLIGLLMLRQRLARQA